MNQGILLGHQAIQRVALSTTVILVNALRAWTEEYFGVTQGLYIAFLIFVVSTQLNQKKAQPRLLKRVTLLYCNQQIRKLVVINDLSPTSVFSDILLAIGMAIITMMMCDSKNSSAKDDLQYLLNGMMYLYGDTFDFAFQYGVFKITAFAFGVSVILKNTQPKTDQLQLFCWNLASIISINLLSEGITTLLHSTSIQIDIVQCLATTTILKLLFPSMESYLTYLTAMQLMVLAPGIAPSVFCAVVWINELPESSRSWVGGIGFTYVIMSISNYVVQTPFWGMILILTLAHYIDYIIQAYL
jgi:hypothetical protein